MHLQNCIIGGRHRHPAEGEASLYLVTSRRADSLQSTCKHASKSKESRMDSSHFLFVHPGLGELRACLAQPTRFGFLLKQQEKTARFIVSASSE